MVAAQDDGQRAGIRKAPDRRFGAGVVFARRLRQVGDDVAAVDEADVVAALQQRAVDIEIIVPGRARDPVGGLPDRGGRIGLVVAEIGREYGVPNGMPRTAMSACRLSRSVSSSAYSSVW